MFLETNCTCGHMLYKSVMEVNDNTSKLDFFFSEYKKTE